MTKPVKSCNGKDQWLPGEVERVAYLREVKHQNWAQIRKVGSVPALTHQGMCGLRVLRERRGNEKKQRSSWFALLTKPITQIIGRHTELSITDKYYAVKRKAKARKRTESGV